MACTLVAFQHSKIIALKQKLNLGIGLLQTLFIRTSKEKSNLVLTWDKVYLFLSCHLQNEWRVWAGSSVTTVNPAADTRHMEHQGEGSPGEAAHPELVGTCWQSPLSSHFAFSSCSELSSLLSTEPSSSFLYPTKMVQISWG